MDARIESQRFMGRDAAQDPALAAQDARQMGPIYDRNFLPWIPVERGAALLDFGCGYGTFLRYLAEKGYGNLTGADPDPRSVAAARAFAPAAKILHVPDPKEFLRANPGAFDLISAMSVIGYFERGEVLSWFRELRGALKPGGRLLLDVNNFASISGMLDFVQDPFFQTPFTDVSLRDLLEAAGFEIEALHGIRIPVSTPKRAAWLVAQALWRQAFRLILLLERGRGERNPKVLGTRIVVVARAPDAD